MSEELIAKIDRHIDEHFEQYLEDLRSLCQLPSVAAQGQAIGETAELTRVLLEKYGVPAEVLPTARNPVVYGEASGASGQTVLCYNHYDVQMTSSRLSRWSCGSRSRSTRWCGTGRSSGVGLGTTRGISFAGWGRSTRCGR